MAAQLELHGEDWRPRRLEERQARLAKLLARTPAGIQYTEHLEGDGAAIFAHACKLRAQGTVTTLSRSGSSRARLKDQESGGPPYAAVPGGA